MIKDLIEELLLVVLLIVALYLLWTKFLSGYFGKAAAAVSGVIEKEKAAVTTITTAASSPVDTLKDFWAALTAPDYISPDQYRENIALIQKNLQEN